MPKKEFDASSKRIIRDVSNSRKMQDSFSNSIVEKGWTGISKKTKIITNPLN